MELTDALEDYLDNADDRDFEKAEKILDKAGDHLSIIRLKKNYEVEVPSQSNSGHSYHVFIKVNKSNILVSCECPAYDQTGDCKHAVAAVLYLYDHLLEAADDREEWNAETEQKKANSNGSSGKKTKSLAPLPVKNSSLSFEMNGINLALLFRLGRLTERQVIPWINRVEELSLQNPDFRFLLTEKKKRFDVHIYYDGRQKFEATCACQSNELCPHTVACFYYLYFRYGPHYFTQFKNFDQEKSQVLKRYGLTLADPEAADFQWSADFNGNLTMTRKPSYLQSTGNASFLQEFRKNLSGDEIVHGQVRPPLPENFLISYEIGALFNFSSAKHIGFELDLLQITDKNGRTKINKLKIAPANYALLKPLPDELYNTLVAFSDDALIEHLALAGEGYLKSYQNPWQQIRSEEPFHKLRQRYFLLLQRLWPLLTDIPVYQLPRGERFSQANIKPVTISQQPVKISFTVERTEKFIGIHLRVNTEDKALAGPVLLLSGLIFEHNNKLYLASDAEMLPVLHQFSDGKFLFPLAEQKEVFLNVILPLQRKYDVTISDDIAFSVTEGMPQSRVMLSELNDQHLLIRPQFLYDDQLLDYSLDNDLILEENGKLNILKRNKGEEKKLYTFLRTLHPRFSSQNNHQHYYIPFTEVMKNNWFFTMISQIEAAGYPVYGLQDLKKFRYNKATPVINIEAGSGIDWFDLKISAQWGDQQVSIQNLRRAIINRQEAVLLDDGTLGVIPQEWISQYATLMKISDEQNGVLRVSKLHFGLLDQLDALKDEAVVEEINLKKSRLREFKGVELMPVPVSIKAELRPYQLAGFHWMQTLDSLGWGGCLADDMGLGKTLQTITFLQYVKETNPGSTSLVICPTSLLFNWENELEKFCPTLKYHIYYGQQRAFSHEHFNEYDLVLTSYGIARNDLKDLLEFEWHYVILDESQAIKNPEAQVTRAVSHLKAKNKLILSGTPVQNNTQDLFAQFHFLNPGMLGSREFFKQEFAQAIDKKENKEKAGQLRKLVAPFMLRRTKEQVAQDLPDKTETILWCSMGRAQRSLYDDYKNYYRHLLLKKIDEEGIAKAGIYVLEGLLRLRQICDHPLLVKDEEQEVKESVKNEELLREIQENTGEHKLLVFSQFTEMLQLIREDLQKSKISFCYLDGSTPAAKRQEQVEQFQNDESVKVFLISLKAGGVGLNLTAADYVYLVDPWWNPAAEQQAIDRTHRIGQTRKIFAYKMICKDTVEEKILQLQQKKKALVQELVSEDDGFSKKLTREDVAFLFS